MSCNDKAKIEDLIIDINKDIKIDSSSIDPETGQLSAQSIQDILDQLTDAGLCKAPSDPVFTMDQLSQLGCDIEPSNELPDINIDLGDIDTSATDETHSCEAAINEANKILKKEQQEYLNLNMLLQKLIEYRDNYRVLKEYYSERLLEMNRLIADFQPVLEIIKDLESQKTAKINERSALYVELINETYGSLRYNELTSQYYELNDEILEINSKITSNQNTINQRTAANSILSDSSLISSVSDALEGGSTYSTSLYNAISNTLSSANFNQLKNSIQNYSTSLKIESNNSFNIQTYINRPIVEFKIDFIGLDFIKSEEDVYNEETGERSTREVNFKIKESNLLKTNSFFKEVNGLEINNESFDTEFTGVLYTEYYNKLNNPIEELFTLKEKGLTNSETLVDPELKDSTFNKKREGSSEYYIQDRKKLEKFYENFEQNLEKKKKQIRDQKIEPAFTALSSNLKNLARMDVALLLAVGGININIIDENANLNTIIETVKQAQESFIKKSSDLDSEISRIKTRMAEIKPTADRVKELLIELDSACFSQQDEPVSEADLEAKVKDAKGKDPFGAKSFDETDPTLPSIYDYRYWLEFSKVVNKVGLLPLPSKIPTSLRYWPIGLFFPTPVGKLIKIPLPIIWIPLLVTPTPIGVTVIFLTINGLFISPIIFNINATGTKQHILTARGPSRQFGYTDDPISQLLRLPLNLASAKLSSLNQGGLTKLSKTEKESYEAELKALEEKRDRATPGSRRYNKIQSKIDNLKESVSGKSQEEITKEAIDKEESPQDAIDNAKSSVKDRMNQLGEPEFSNSRAIQQQIENRRVEKRKEIDKVYESDLPPKEKRKKLKQLRKELKEEGVSKQVKEDAIRKDSMSFFDKIKLPSIKIPADSTKLNPPPTAMDQLKDRTEENASNFKDDPTAKENRMVKNAMRRELPNIAELIEINDIPVNANNKIEILGNEAAIKSKLNQINQAIVDKLKGVSDLNVEQTEQQIEDLKTRIESEQDNSTKKQLKRDLKKLEAKLSNHNEAQQNKKDNSLNQEKLDEVSDTKFSFNPLKSLSELQPKKTDFTPKENDLLPISQADSLLKSYISGLTSNDIISLFGGAKEVTVSSIQDVHFNIINTQVPDTLVMKNKISSKDILKSSSGVLSSIAIPSKEIGLLSAFTLSKKIPIDLNMLLGPLRKKVMEDLQNLDGCLPIDIENNFSSLSSTDIKVFMENKVIEKLDTLTSILVPLYILIKLAKSTKGITLSQSQITSFLTPPFGPLDFALFTATTLAKVNAPNSNSLGIYNIEAIKKAKETIDPILSPIMDNPISYIIPASAASIGLAKAQRLLHPVIAADDIPPWERLSSRNFLFVLFLDEFISEAAEKVGFFRSFI